MTPFNQFFKNMTKPWVPVSYVLLMVIFFLYLDAPIALFFHQIELGYIQPLSECVTYLGKAKPLMAFLFLLMLFFRYIVHWKQCEMRALFLWLCTFFPSVIVLGLKIIFGRARPELLFQDGIYGFHWLQYSRPFWSFPSGHTATLMGCVFGLCIIWPRYRWMFLCVGFLVMLSRVILLQHYLTDVLVSAYLALIEVWILQFVLNRYAPSLMKEVHA